MEQDDVQNTAFDSLPFEQFWAWVQSHPNCILRVANASMVLFDDDDYHWHFGVETETVCFVQVIRGKRYSSFNGLRRFVKRALQITEAEFVIIVADIEVSSQQARIIGIELQGVP